MIYSQLFDLPKVTSPELILPECGGLRMVQREHLTKMVVTLSINQCRYFGEVWIMRVTNQCYSTNANPNGDRVVDLNEAIAVALSTLD